MNQLTVGASGKTTFPICAWNMQKSHGKFIYGESLLNGYALVHVTKHAIDVRMFGVKYLNETEAAEADKDKKIELLELHHHHHHHPHDEAEEEEVAALDAEVDEDLDEMADSEMEEVEDLEEKEEPELEGDDEINDEDFDFSEDTKKPKKAGFQGKDIEDSDDKVVKKTDTKALA